MIVSQIAAMSKNRVIGTQNTLPWNIPEDLQYFKSTTVGHICIMGRKTFESVGSKPLPKRMNIVVTRNQEFRAGENVTIVASIDEALKIAKTAVERDRSQWPEEVFIVGGGEIYKAALSKTDRIYLTEIDKTIPGEAYFPEFSKVEFKEVKRETKSQSLSAEGELKFDFVVYERAGI